MSHLRGRDVHSAKGPARDSTQSFELVSDADRELLCWHLRAAASEVFPESEKMGKTAQQDFYFRELLECLLLNFEKSQAPITGGNHAEVWALARSVTPKWRARPEAKKRRSGYDRKSIKTMVNEWKRAVGLRPRSYQKRGVIEFVLQVPDENCDDVVLFATITDFSLIDGQLFSVARTELTDEIRLPAPALDDSESTAERERLLSRASRIVRDVEQKYLEKLHEAPLELVTAEVEALERDKRRRDYRRLAAAIVVILGAGMAAYKILSIRRFVPVFDVSKTGHRAVANVISDHKGHLALAHDGKAVSPWANAIIDEGGNGVSPDPTKPGSVLVLAQNLTFRATIPERWKANDPAVLPSEGTCFTMDDSDDLKGPIIGCHVLYDLRAIAPTLNANNITLAFDFGEKPISVRIYKREEFTCANSNCSRVRTWIRHEYTRDGRYPIRLFVFEGRDWQKDGVMVNGMPLVAITINNKKLVSVSSLSGNNFVFADPVPEDTDPHAKAKQAKR
jgi:hypothetical protein